MTQTHLAAALLAVTHDSSVKALAERAGVAQSTLSRMVTKGTRAEPDTLEMICAQLSPLQAREILVAHVRDEITRAGFTALDLDLITPDDPGADLNLLARVSDEPEFKAMIGELARFARSFIALKNSAESTLAAEPGARYDRRK